MGWIYLSSPKLQWCDCWSLGMDKWFHPTHYWACDYLSMLGLKLIHVIKRCPWYSQVSLLRGLLVQYQLLHGLSQQCQLMHGNYCMICYCSFRVRKQIILWTHKRFPIPPLKGELWTICCVLKKMLLWDSTVFASPVPSLPYSGIITSLSWFILFSHVYNLTFYLWLIYLVCGRIGAQ